MLNGNYSELLSLSDAFWFTFSPETSPICSSSVFNIACNMSAIRLDDCILIVQVLMIQFKSVLIIVCYQILPVEVYITAIKHHLIFEVIELGTKENDTICCQIYQYT